MNVYLPLSAQLTRLFEDPRVMSKNNPLCSLSKSRKRAYRNLATLIVEIHKDAVQKNKRHRGSFPTIILPLNRSY